MKHLPPKIQKTLSEYLNIYISDLENAILHDREYIDFYTFWRKNRMYENINSHHDRAIYYEDFIDFAKNKGFELFTIKKGKDVIVETDYVFHFDLRDKFRLATWKATKYSNENEHAN